MSTNSNMRHLYLRGKTWWYYRRVPTKIAAVLSEKSRQRYSLQTNILEFAQHKRNLIEISQNEYWGNLPIFEIEAPKQINAHHDRLIKLIISDSIKFESADEITYEQKIKNLTKRIEILENRMRES